MNNQYISKVVDLTDSSKNVIYNMSHEEAVEIVRSGDLEAVRKNGVGYGLVDGFRVNRSGR